MNVIFKNPITRKFEVGAIFKVHNTKRGKKYDVVSESGIEHLRLSSNPKKEGYVDFEKTKKINPETKLNKHTKGNFRYVKDVNLSEEEE